MANHLVRSNAWRQLASNFHNGNRFSRAERNVRLWNLNKIRGPWTSRDVVGRGHSLIGGKETASHSAPILNLSWRASITALTNIACSKKEKKKNNSNNNKEEKAKEAREARGFFFFFFLSEA
jgi:hypothetical protein